MDQFASFGYWVQRRRKILDMTQADLARKVSCSLSMLRKIERDERRPSEQLADLLAVHLAIDEGQRTLFLQMARGQFTPDMLSPTEAGIRLVDTGRPAEQAPFVARESELEQLHEHLDRASNGRGRMLIIAGEAGRGKTSLLIEFAHQALAAQPELLVAGGSSDVYTGLGDPLLPFRDIFRLLAGDSENSALGGIVDRELAARLTRALPATAEILLDQGPHLIDTIVPGSTLEARLAQSYPEHQVSAELLIRLHDRRSRNLALELQQERLFEEISTTLTTLARHYPLLLILDDLQWADASTVGLLGHLASRLQQTPILLVGSLRPEELAPAGEADRHPLQEVLSESRRLFGENRINLDRSRPGGELDFVNALLDEEPNRFDPDFRRQLARITEGNALFSVELLREMKDRGDIKRDGDGQWFAADSLSWQLMPARIEGVLEKRLTRLPDDLRGVLDAASVQGEAFTAEAIAEIKQLDIRRLTRMLSSDLDRRHRLVREQGVQHVGARRLSQYRFRHHLFQKYLYEQLATAERLYLHEDTGSALEKLFAGQADGAPSEYARDIPAAQLARHFEEALLYAKASHYLLLAGQNAARVFASDEAAAHFERGLSLLAELGQTPDIERLKFDLTLALGRAYWHSDKVAETMDTYAQAIEIARTLQDPPALATAVLAYEEPRWRLTLDSGPSQQYIREALAALGEEESVLRVRLLVNLAGALLASGAEQEALNAMVNQALQNARQVNDPVALMDALRNFAQVDRRPEMTETRLAAEEEMASTAETLGELERLSDALDLLIYDHLELGNIDLVDEKIAAQKEVAEEIKQPLQLHVAAVFRTMRAIMRGEFEEAERLANEAAEISRQIGMSGLDGIFGMHMFTIRAEQGRLHEIAPIVELIVAQNPASATWRPGLALLYAVIGDEQRCRDVFNSLAKDDFAVVPRDSMWVTSLAFQAESCAFLRDGERAATLYDLLLPYDGRAVVAGGATACYGAAGRYLGMLATTRGDWQAAERHFQDALQLDARMGARPWLAHTQAAYAAMLLARGVPQDRQRALALVETAAGAAREMGMARLLQKATALQKAHELA